MTCHDMLVGYVSKNYNSNYNRIILKTNGPFILFRLEGDTKHESEVSYMQERPFPCSFHCLCSFADQLFETIVVSPSICKLSETI